MGFERSPFGDGVLVGSGGNVYTNVNNHYGQRDSVNVVGVVKTEGSTFEAYWDFDAATLTAGAFDLLAPVLPAGAVIDDVYMSIETAFVVSGTSPGIDFGTEGSEATNGFSVTEAQLEATGSYDLTSALSGTWAAPLAAETTVGIAFFGTGSPAVTDVGRGRVVVRYTVVPQ